MNIPQTSFLSPTSPLSSFNLFSSFQETTQFQTTIQSAIICAFQVPNCQFCGSIGPLIDLCQVNVSCIFDGKEWKWCLKSKTGSITNTGEIVISGNTTSVVEGNIVNNANLTISTNSSVIIVGNLTQNTGGQIVFTFDPQQQNNNNKSVALNVGGCVSLNGNISLNLETQPQQGTTNLQLISYNCSQQVNISSSQIGVIPNYNGSECDTINSQAINQQGSLGVSLTSILGNKCNGGNGKNLGLIIGLAVGIPCGVALILGVSLALQRKSRKKKLDKVFSSLDNEMKNIK